MGSFLRAPSPTTAILLALGVLGCGQNGRGPAPGDARSAEHPAGAAIRLISEAPRGPLTLRELGTAVRVREGSFEPPMSSTGSQTAWKPVALDGSWRIAGDALVIGSAGTSFDLESVVELRAGDLHRLEVVLASCYRVRLSLGWRRQDDPAGERRWSSLEYHQGLGEQEGRTFTFDLLSDARWSGSITDLRLRFELALPEEITVWRIQGWRHDVTQEDLARLARRSWIVELDHELRAALLVPPGHPVERLVQLPERSQLRFAIGATGRLAAPITLRVALAPIPGERSVLWETTLEPEPLAGSRRWQPVTVDLEDWGGERVSLTVESRPGEAFDPALGVPAWAHPEIVPAGPERARPDVVLVSIDTLRADHLSLYGYARDTTARIDGWARRHAVVFRHSVVQAPWTLPSHGSLLTGLDALSHGVNHPYRAAPADLTTLAEMLGAAGYFTAGITGGAWLHPHYGLAQGYDLYRYWPGDGRGDVELEAHAGQALRWLDELRRPFFLFVHTFDVHDFKSRGRRGRATGSDVDRYDLAVRHMDREIGRLLDRFGERLRGEAVLALTSDHGQDLGEDQGRGSLRDHNLLVPLVIELPDGRGAGRVVDEQVRSIDIVPTILALAGVEVPLRLDGASLLPLIDGGARRSPPALTYFSSTAPDQGLSVRLRNRWKYWLNPSAWAPEDRREALFLLPDDAVEQNNLAPDHPRTAAFRALAQRSLDERLNGLRLRLENPTSRSFAGRLRGAPSGIAELKATDWPTCVTRLAEDAVGFTVPPAGRCSLLFERRGRPDFELEARAGSGGSHRLDLDLRQVALPATYRLTASGWRLVSIGEHERAPGVTIGWHRTAVVEDVAPYERDPELRRQLEALGYLE